MAKKVRVIPATIDRTTSAPISSGTKRKVAGYARVSTELEEQQSSYEAQVTTQTTSRAEMTGSSSKFIQMKVSPLPAQNTGKAFSRWWRMRWTARSI